MNALCRAFDSIGRRRDPRRPPRAGRVLVLATTDPTTIRPARISERGALADLQRRSSMHHPMYRTQLAAHPDAIELPAEQITAGHVRVAERSGAVVGFAVLLERAGDACELDGLFAEPERMRAGIGRRLVADAIPAPRMSLPLAAGTHLSFVFRPSDGGRQATHVKAATGPTPGGWTIDRG